MIIIEYRRNDDIDIKFEDGTIVKHKRYYNFKNGNIKNPNLKNKNIKKHNYIQERTGETSIAKSSQTMTIIEYRKYNDIDIQFEDGTIVKNRNYTDFKKGYIKNPNYKKESKLNLLFNQIKKLRSL